MKVDFFLQADKGPFGCVVREYVRVSAEGTRYEPGRDITEHVDAGIKAAHPKEYARFQALLAEQPHLKKEALEEPGTPIIPGQLLKAEIEAKAKIEAELQKEAAEAAKAEGVPPSESLTDEQVKEEAEKAISELNKEAAEAAKE